MKEGVGIVVWGYFFFYIEAVNEKVVTRKLVQWFFNVKRKETLNVVTTYTTYEIHFKIIKEEKFYSYVDSFNQIYFIYIYLCNLMI